MENLLKQHIESSSLVKAAVIEAVHRFYYDNVLDDNKHRWPEEKRVAFTESELLISNLWNLVPDWRKILVEYPERYGKNHQEANSGHINNKPSEIVQTDITITFPVYEVEVV